MKRIVTIVSLIFAFLLGACFPVVAEAAQDRPLKIWFENKNGRYTTLCIVDENTGVNYVVVSGNYDYTVAITPRLNADGSLYVTD